MRIKTTAAALTVMMGLGVLSACSGTTDETTDTAADEITWASCGEQLECATIAVPLTADDPDGETVDIAVTKLLATGDSHKALFFNPGGPGASGTATVEQAGTSLISPTLREQYDLIGFDPRGVGKSGTVVCLDDAARDAANYPTDPGAVDLEAQAREMAEACAAHSGDLLPSISTITAAHDLDALREALGEDTLDYFGVSYGTTLGSTYAELFPERVGRMVLDSATDLDLSTAEMTAAQAVGFENALRAYVASTEGTADAPFTGTTEEAMAGIRDLITTLDAEPMIAGDGRAVSGYVVRTAIMFAMYSERMWPTLTVALNQLRDGSPDTILQLADALNQRSGGTYVDTALDPDALLAYNCMDVPAASAEQIAAANAEIAENAPTLGSPLDLAADPCSYWSVETTPLPEIDAAGAAPIVVIGSTNDPATPYAWSAAMAEDIESSIHLTRVGEGHGAYNVGNDCITEAVDAYLIDGTAPADGLTCEA